MLLTGPSNDAGILAIGGYPVMVATLLPSLMGEGPLGRIGRIAACGLASLQIAALVDQTGYSPLAWGTYGLLVAAVAVLGWNNQRLREAGGIAAALAMFLIAAWPDPASNWLAAIAGCMSLLFLAPALAHIARSKEGLVDWAMVIGFPVAMMAAVCVQLQINLIEAQNVLMALTAFTLALFPAAAVWLRWGGSEQAKDERITAAACSAILMIALAGITAVPVWATPIVLALLAAGVFVLFGRRPEKGFLGMQWALPAGALVLLLADLRILDELEGLVGFGIAVKSQRSWRIGSLIFMLGAVGKVFLFDAAGLEGLARIASFLALGFCLIGIGWFYSKQLRSGKPDAQLG